MQGPYCPHPISHRRSVESPEKSWHRRPHRSFLSPSSHPHSIACMASIFQAFPQLRTAAPRLSRRLFVCKPCLNSPIPSSFAASRSAAPRPSVLQSVRWKSTQPLRSSATLAASHVEAPILAEAARQGAKTSSFPKTSSKSVAYWLLGSAASVFGIVVFGGLTRLTESG
jgi:cytochrome c oxidase assembly protein subunit 15